MGSQPFPSLQPVMDTGGGWRKECPLTDLSRQPSQPPRDPVRKSLAPGLLVHRNEKLAAEKDALVTGCKATPGPHIPPPSPTSFPPQRYLLGTMNVIPSPPLDCILSLPKQRNAILELSESFSIYTLPVWIYQSPSLFFEIFTNVLSVDTEWPPEFLKTV